LFTKREKYREFLEGHEENIRKLEVILDHVANTISEMKEFKDSDYLFFKDSENYSIEIYFLEVDRVLQICTIDIFGQVITGHTISDKHRESFTKRITSRTKFIRKNRDKELKKARFFERMGMKKLSTRFHVKYLGLELPLKFSERFLEFIDEKNDIIYELVGSIQEEINGNIHYPYMHLDRRFEEIQESK
jgi:hypothetical protein